MQENTHLLNPNFIKIHSEFDLSILIPFLSGGSCSPACIAGVILVTDMWSSKVHMAFLQSIGRLTRVGIEMTWGCRLLSIAVKLRKIRKQFQTDLTEHLMGIISCNPGPSQFLSCSNLLWIEPCTCTIESAFGVLQKPSFSTELLHCVQQENDVKMSLLAMVPQKAAMARHRSLQPDDSIGPSSGTLTLLVNHADFKKYTKAGQMPAAKPRLISS